MNSGIYLITCQPHGRLPLYYIGQSKNIHLRFGQHKTSLRSGSHFNRKLQNFWNAHGSESFKFEPLEFCEVDKLDDFEQWWINETIGHDRVFNVGTDPAAPSRGRKFSAEHKARIAAALTGQNHYAFGKRLSEGHREKISIGGRGVKRGDKTRQRISDANRGPKNSMYGKSGAMNSRSKAVIATSLKTGEILRYESATLAKVDGFDQSAISRSCHGKTRGHKGYQWRFAEIISEFA